MRMRRRHSTTMRLSTRETSRMPRDANGVTLEHRGKVLRETHIYQTGGEACPTINQRDAYDGPGG